MSLRRVGHLLAVLALAGCGGNPAPQTAPQTVVRLEPPRVDESAPLPNLPVSQSGTISEGSAPRLQSLNAVNQPVGAVVRELATKFGLQYQIDPDVRGLVNANLRNATLAEALNVIVPQGATYDIRDGVLRVAPARVETRIFTLDYVALSRVGTASTVIQRRLGNAGGGGLSGGLSGGVSGASGLGGGIGGVGGGADVISAVSIADVWEEIRVAVEALVFDSIASQQTQTAAAGLSGLAGGTGGTRPYSRTGESGRRLIINPIAGTITVSALASRLEQVDVFIRTFEASIQRQVLIEAKIVEVNLDRSFEFGIDWNLLARDGTGFSLSPGARSVNNAEFTLKAGATQVSAVLTALESQGDVRVLSSPRVSALNNQRAVFDVTTGEIVFNVTRQPIVGPTGTVSFSEFVTPTQVNVGIVLDVLPQVGADNTVTMNIRPVVTSVARTAEYTSPDGGVVRAPVIDTRESDTMARLRGGETIIIGGLMQNRREKVKGGIPILRSIPLLGLLFTRYTDIERKAELVIFLTPTIIAGQPPAAR